MKVRAAYREQWERSRAHLEKGELGLAIEALREAIALQPRDTFLWEEVFKLCMLGGSTRNALVAAFKLRELDAHNANYVYMHGIASLVDGQLDEASTILEDALRRAPDSLEVRRALAQTYEALRRPEHALQLLEQALERYPTEPGLVNDLAVHYLGQPDGKPRAERILQRLLAKHPEDAAAHLNLALALLEKAPIEARAHAQRAIQADDASIREQAQKLLDMLGP